ncbi:MAG: Hpt domain-containing protein [Aeromonadaceae bacterium]
MLMAAHTHILPTLRYLNKPHLLKLVDDDLDLVQTLLSSYLHSTPDELAAFSHGISSGDARETALYAHRLRGSLRYLGAKAIEQLLYEAETAVRAGDQSRLLDCYRRILPAMQQLQQEVFDWQSELSNAA